ncbi:MAG: transposase [Ectothiorhodospiraceae bacterium]|nr:transposase [Ectothiorhodospiraceae bacterium]
MPPQSYKHPGRRSIRLKEFDYTQNGVYFVTLCIQDRLELFGKVQGGDMILNDSGKMVERIWLEIPDHCTDFHNEGIQIMPNHLHGILLIMDGEIGEPITANGRIRGSAPTARLSLADVMQRFKILTTKLYTDGVKERSWRRFNTRLWQRNYWERIIRNDRELREYKQYLAENPLRWQYDVLNEQRIG